LRLLLQPRHGKCARLTSLLAASACLGCTVPIARDLEDGSANQIALALQRAGTESTKEPDPEHEGRWALSVARAEVPSALEVLAREGLPRPHGPGLSELSEQRSLVPSLQLEQTRLLTGAANDVERSLASIDGVVSARVHVAPTTWDPLGQPEMAPSVPSVSVLVRYRGPHCPISPHDIQRLVAGAVATRPDDVQVVATPLLDHSDGAPRLVRFGPLLLLRESARLLRFAVGVSVALNLTTLALLIYFWARAREKRPVN